MALLSVLMRLIIKFYLVIMTACCVYLLVAVGLLIYIDHRDKPLDDDQEEGRTRKKKR